MHLHNLKLCNLHSLSVVCKILNAVSRILNFNFFLISDSHRRVPARETLFRTYGEGALRIHYTSMAVERL